jgi:hypothetical protein
VASAAMARHAVMSRVLRSPLSAAEMIDIDIPPSIVAWFILL